MRVLGLSFSGHGTAVCLVEDGRIAAAVNLERLTAYQVCPRDYPAVQTDARSGDEECLRLRPRASDRELLRGVPALAVFGLRRIRVRDAGIDLVVKTHDNIRPISATRAVRRLLRLLRGDGDVLRPRAPRLPRLPGIPGKSMAITLPS